MLEVFCSFDTCSLLCFRIVCENRVAVNQRTFPVERRKDASLTITGKASNANADRDTQESHAVSLLATHLALFKLKITLHSDNMADPN